MTQEARAHKADQNPQRDKERSMNAQQHPPAPADVLMACLLAILVAVLGVCTAVPVGADTPQPVTATFQVLFAGGAHGTFTATAPLPTSGTFVDSPVAPSIRAGVVHVTRVMTAAGGTVDATWTAKFISPNASKGVWVITGGTGAFANLHAHGTTSIITNHEVSAVEMWEGLSP
jgi:hypothetical protein